MKEILDFNGGGSSPSSGGLMSDLFEEFDRFRYPAQKVSSHGFFMKAAASRPLQSVSRCGASVLEADFLICMIGTSNETLSLLKLYYMSRSN